MLQGPIEHDIEQIMPGVLAMAGPRGPPEPWSNQIGPQNLWPWGGNGIRFGAMGGQPNRNLQNGPAPIEGHLAERPCTVNHGTDHMPRAMAYLFFISAPIA